MSHIIDAYKWREESLKGLVCSKFQCYNKPRIQCSECSIHYCNDHITSEDEDDEEEKEDEDEVKGNDDKDNN